MEKYYAEEITDLAQKLTTDLEAGLPQHEAQKRLNEVGENRLEASAKKSLLAKFVDQFKDFMIIVLIVAALLSGVVAKEWTDAAIILVVVLLNALLGVIQEARSEAAIDALKEMATPHCRVMRDGTVKEISAEDLVPGDLVLLEAGDVVPADLRLISAESLKIEEAALTGESVPVEKSAITLADEDVPLGDRVNMAYASTSVTYGRATGLVVNTGMKSEVGKIATLINNADETQTPLKENLNQLGKTLTLLILGVCVVVFAVGFFTKQGTMPTDTLMIEMFLIAVSLAVAAIPEGLPAIVTIILALGTQSMAKKKSIVRKLPAVETLGATDVICSDKTGTLTQNKMTVEETYEIVDGMILPIMTLCNDTKVSGDELLGDPTETALISYAQKQDFHPDNQRVQELPFDSDRKLMTTVNEWNGQYLVAVKGAPDELLKRCKINDASKEEVLAKNLEMAKKALRVLGLAYKIVDQPFTDLTIENVENDLTFAGLVGMIDPERPSAKQAVAEAKNAGIEVVMITGDHQITASAIAKRLGIIDQNDDDRVITGSELDKLSEADFAGKVKHYRVYARVSPEHKVRIVKAWQNAGKIVAMTGDGVNDAPSLKQADIGIGMGITGTEVAKGASDMILADDNFRTIVDAVKEGRKVFSNIQKAILYLMSCNVGEVLTVFAMTMLGWDILAPVQLLWINLVTDTLPAICLGIEPVEKGIMKQKPRGKQSTFFSGGVSSAIVFEGVLEAVLVLAAYQIGLHVGPHVATPKLQHADALTMAFLTLALIQLFHAINSKFLHDSIFSKETLKNKWFNYAIIVSALIVAMVELPGLNQLFLVTELLPIQWAVVLGAGILMVVFVEIYKFIKRR